MKKFLYALLLLPALVSGQSQDQNYIKTTIYKKPTLNGADINTLYLPAYPAGVITDADKMVNVTYFDGLGRPIEQISKSDMGKDIIAPIAYDAFGRREKEYLPYPSANTNMAYVEVGTTAIPDAATYYGNLYGAEGNNPYSQKEFEPSPLSRVLKQAAPGDDWKLSSGHAIKMDYQTNAENEVKRYATTAADPLPEQDIYLPSALSQNGTYPAGELYKTITYDENTAASPTETDGSTVEFKDKEGRVVLKRIYEETAGALDTYYVYDQYGNLTYVIPPLATDPVNVSGQLSALCYQYKYDYRNRLVEKKLPGKQWEFIVYDKLDRVVATGPAFSPLTDIPAPDNTGWLITKYDVFNRVVYTGWLQSSTVNAAERISMQGSRVNAAVISEAKITTNNNIDNKSIYYTTAVAPTSFRILTVNYYDNYTFPKVNPSLFTSVEGQTTLTASQVKGLQTGIWNRYLATTAMSGGNTQTLQYDQKARLVNSYKELYITGGYTVVSTLLDFEGKTVSTATDHVRNATSIPVTTKDRFTYTPTGKMLKHTHQIGSGTEQLLSLNTYDDLGQLVSKNVGGIATGTGLQKVDYKYNIRGWLKGINDIDVLSKSGEPTDLFAFKINYNEQSSGFSDVKALYNGNIAETLWRTGSDNIPRKYGYSYDNLNRLRYAHFLDENTALNTAYDEWMDYDKNGNIMHLQRNGNTGSYSAPNVIGIDNLGYSYNGNLLMKVADQTGSTVGFKDDSAYPDTTDDYIYDLNGNLTSDTNKGISNITYNHLNLPVKIEIGANKIEYYYTASGEKMKKMLTVSGVVTNTDYLDGFQYEKGVLQFFPTAEGYVKNTNFDGANHYNYVFNYTDHLGNVRLSYAEDPVNGGLKIMQEDNYYAFGLKHSGYNNSPTYEFMKNISGNSVILASGNVKNKYKFQGQERQDELGLNWDSFKWRNYDYAIGRFMSVDPLAEKYAYNSPYAFSENRVIDGRELEGLEWENFRTTGKNPGSLKQKSPSEDAQRQHYSVTVSNSKKSFSEFKSDFKESPQSFLTNSKAEFNAPVDGDGNPTDFGKGSFIKIDIDGPMNNGYVKVVGMEDKKDKLTTTFGTMEGHMEKGKITFGLKQNKDGSITFSIDSKSEVDMGLAPEGFSRSQQKKSWNEVLNNITKYLNGDVTKKEEKIVEPKKKE